MKRYSPTVDRNYGADDGEAVMSEDPTGNWRDGEEVDAELSRLRGEVEEARLESNNRGFALLEARAELADLRAELTAAYGRIAELVAMLAALESPPVVPYPFRVELCGTNWCVSWNVAPTNAEYLACVKARIWAEEHNARPPHAADAHTGEEVNNDK